MSPCVSMCLCVLLCVVCCVCCVLCAVCAVCVVCVWCDTPEKSVCAKRPPCVDSKRPRVYRHHAHCGVKPSWKVTCVNMVVCTPVAPRARVETHARAAGTHGDVLNLHTEGVLHKHTGEEGGCRRQVCLPKFAHEGFFRGAREVHQRNKSRTTHCRVLRSFALPDELFSFSYPEGDAGGNQL